MMHIKYCKKCEQAFDIATNFKLCPKCRKEEEQNEWEKDNRRRTRKT